MKMTSIYPSHTHVETHSDTVSIDPGNMLTESDRAKFQSMVQTYEEVFDSHIQGYNRSMESFEAKINMGPVQPPQRKRKPEDQ